MPRRTQKEAVAGRTQHPSADGLAEKASRRGRRKAAEAQAPEESPSPKSRPREKTPRKERKPRVHADLLTVACAPRGVRCESPNALVTQ